MLRWLLPTALGAAVALVVGCSVSRGPEAFVRPSAPASHVSKAAGPTRSACPPLLVRTLRLADRGAPDGTRYAQVFTPPGAAHPERLPVLYFLHGYPGGGDNIGGGPTAATFRAQMCAGARRFILVATVRPRRPTSVRMSPYS